jgi:hypothetical protein
MPEIKTVHSQPWRKLYLIFFLLLTLFLSSCSVSITCVLYNNTLTKIKVDRIENSIVKETFEVTPNESIELEAWDTSNYQITITDKIFRYNEQTPYIPNFEYDYVQTTGIGFWVKRLIFVQLESDGRIYLLRKNQKAPIAKFGEQPQGYPLVPHIVS